MKAFQPFPIIEQNKLAHVYILISFGSYASEEWNGVFPFHYLQQI